MALKELINLVGKDAFIKPFYQFWSIDILWHSKIY